MSTFVPVGVCALVLDVSRHILLGRRKGKHGAGKLSCPGGALELGEQLVDGVIRELKEETGLIGTATHKDSYPYSVDLFPEMKQQWVTFYIPVVGFGTPKLMEPDKCEGWDWYPWDNFPEDVWVGLDNLPRRFDPWK